MRNLYVSERIETQLEFSAKELVRRTMTNGHETFLLFQ